MSEHEVEHRAGYCHHCGHAKATHQLVSLRNGLEWLERVCEPCFEREVLVSLMLDHKEQTP